MTRYEGARLLQRDGETVQQVVNQWIRTSGTFDGVSDFDAAVREPVHPLQFGYKAMADAVGTAIIRALSTDSMNNWGRA